MHKMLADINLSSHNGIFLTTSQMERLPYRVMTIHSSMLAEHIQLTCDDPQFLYIILPGAGNQPMDSTLYSDGIQVTYTAHRGFGSTGHRMDKDDGTPGYSDHADEGTLHTFCLYLIELLEAGAFFRN